MMYLRSSLHVSELLVAFLAYVIIATTEGVFSTWVAKIMGDSTAADEGYLTWNPFVHIDIIGTLCLLLLGIGWGRGIPVDYRNISNRFKLACVYFSACVCYIFSASFAVAILCKLFGLRLFYDANAVTSLHYLDLSELSIRYPDYSSFLLSLALILIKIMQFGIILAAFSFVLQGIRFFFLAFFPELFYKIQGDSFMFFAIFAASLFFIAPLFGVIYKIVSFLGLLLGLAIGAKW